MVAVLLATIVFVPMLVEWWLSRRNEQRLRQMGAVEPSGDVYALMQLAYPLTFLALVSAAVVDAAPQGTAVAAGFTVFVGAKLLKYWAIVSLGVRWSFRVLVPPGSAPVVSGPYRLLQHPNYVAVMAEIAGAAMIAQAPLIGGFGFALFGALILLRVRVEERALGMRR